MPPIDLGAEAGKRLDLQNEEFQKRHLYLLLFKMYETLPIDSCFTNFAKVFNEVFVKERPLIMTRYSLTQICLAELESQDQQLHIPFTYNFANGTTK